MEAWIKNLFHEVIENMDADEKVYATYFSPRYKQYVDGVFLDYEGFVRHMKKQKEIVSSAKVTIDHCIVQGNRLFTKHRVDLRKITGQEIAVQVMTYYEVEDGKIVLCDELTRLLQGSSEDRYIGSVT